MATTTIYERLKPALEQLGITPQVLKANEYYQFEYEHFTFYLHINVAKKWYFFFLAVDSVCDTLTEETFNDSVEIGAEHYPNTRGIWNDGKPYYFSPGFKLRGRAKVKPEDLAKQIKEFHEAVLFLLGNLFILNDDYYSSLLGDS